MRHMEGVVFAAGGARAGGARAAIVQKHRTRPSDKTGRVKYYRYTTLDTCGGDFQIRPWGTRILIGKSMLILKAEACFLLGMV